MIAFAKIRVMFTLCLFFALQSSSAARDSESDIPASFKGLTRAQQTACIELDALNRTHNVECLEERLWRLEQRAFTTPNTTSKPVKERINALAVELPPSEEIIQEVRTRMANPKRGKLPPELFRDKSGIHEVDATAIDTSKTTGMRRTSASAANIPGYAKLSDDLGKLEETLAKLKKMAQGDASASEVEDSQHKNSPTESMMTHSASAGPIDATDDSGAAEPIRDSAASDEASVSPDRERSGTAGGWPAEYNRPGESEAASADKLGDVAFADLQPSQQLAALEIEHHDKLGTGKTETRLRQLEIEIMGADYVAAGKSEKDRLKALNATSPASTLSMKRALLALKGR